MFCQDPVVSTWHSLDLCKWVWQDMYRAGKVWPVLSNKPCLHTTIIVAMLAIGSTTLFSMVFAVGTPGCHCIYHACTTNESSLPTREKKKHKQKLIMDGLRSTGSQKRERTQLACGSSGLNRASQSQPGRYSEEGIETLSRLVRAPLRNGKLVDPLL